MAKITEEQLKEVLTSQEELGTLLNKIGGLEANKHALLHDIAKVNEKIETTKVNLEKEYGSITIDLKTGEYSIIEQEDNGELAVIKAED